MQIILMNIVARLEYRLIIQTIIVIIRKIHFGIGYKKRFPDRFYIDFGLQVGLRYRALHVAGISKKDEEWFFADTHSDESLTASLSCWEGYTPDCSLIFRVGYDIISFK